MESEPSQQFCLRWHNHQSSVLGGLPALLDSGKLTDVTLCAGGRSLRAHKIVLSACSPYFMDLFKDLPSAQQPVVVVLGGGWAELCCLVAFMYAGEVTLPRDLLPGLLELAAALKITGLTDLNGNVPEAVPEPVPDSELIQDENEHQREEAPALLPVERKIDRIVENLKSNRKKTQEVATRIESVTTALSMETDRPQDTGLRRDCLVEKPFATCYVCRKKLSNQYNLRVHLETHQNARHACAACAHVSRSRDALRKHVSYRHPQLSSSQGVGRPCKSDRRSRLQDPDPFIFPGASQDGKLP